MTIQHLLLAWLPEIPCDLILCCCWRDLDTWYALEDAEGLGDEIDGSSLRNTLEGSHLSNITVLELIDSLDGGVIDRHDLVESSLAGVLDGLGSCFLLLGISFLNGAVSSFLVDSDLGNFDFLLFDCSFLRLSLHKWNQLFKLSLEISDLRGCLGELD